MNISNELKEKIESIPGTEGFWHSSTLFEFMKSANFLRKKGISEEEIYELLSNIYQFSSNDFKSKVIKHNQQIHLNYLK